MLTPDAIAEMLAEHWPAAQVRCLEIGERHAVAVLAPGPESIRPGGFISGPTQFAIADTAFWFMVCGALGRLAPMAMTSELSIRYLRPAQGELLHARADLDRLGRSSVVATVRVWTNDPEKPTAVAQGTYTLARA